MATDRILDYGAGDDYMLRRLLAHGLRHVWAFEPDDHLFRQLAQKVDSLKSVANVQLVKEISLAPTSLFDRVYCLEVLEHLPETLQLEALGQIRRLLRDRGVCIVSVPLEIGLSGLAKNCVRFALGQSHGGANLTSLVKATFGMRIKRASLSYISSHIGFDHRVLPSLFDGSGFDVVQTKYSPLEQLGPVLNSQVFYVLEKRSTR